MPRDITVTFQDGSTHVYRNAPDNLTPDQVSARAQKDFGKAVTNLDGGRKAPQVSSSQALQTYQKARDALFRNVPDAERQKALKRFDADPRNQAIRQQAGLAPLRTRQEEIKDVGRRLASQEAANVERGLSVVRPALGAIPILAPATAVSGKTLTSLKGGLTRSLFGIPERLAAAGLQLTGNAGNLTPQETFEAVKGLTDAQMRQDPVGAFTGSTAGSLLSGGAVGSLVKGGLARLGASGVPALARTGNVLQRLATTQKGQPVSNVVRMATAGAAGGAAQAAGEGSDISEGAAFGALAPVAISGAAQAAKAAGKVVRNVLRKEPVQDILKRYVKTPVEDIQNELTKRQASGVNPAVYEVLPLEDRQALDAAIEKMPAKAREQVASLVRTRARDMVTETAERTKKIVQPGMTKRAREIADDLAASRNAEKPSKQELDLARRASRSPVEMDEVRYTEARNIMAPYDDIVAYKNVSDLLPQRPVKKGKTVSMEATDPDVANMIRSAAGILRVSEEGVKVRDISDMVSTLSDDVVKGGIEGRTAARAITHLEDLLASDHPDVLPAMQRMKDTFAKRSRMLEGMREGARTRLRENVPVTTRQQARDVRQAYDTPEGGAGRAMGQAAQLERDILQNPAQSLQALGTIAENPSAQAAIRANIGESVQRQLGELAETQTEGARRLSRLASESSGDMANADPTKLLQSLMMLSPSTLPGTKIQGAGRIIATLTRLPERQSMQLANSLFSGNPAQISQTIGFLTRTGEPGRQTIRAILNDIGTGALVGGAASRERDSAPIPVQQVSSDIPAEEEPIAEDINSYNEELQDIYDTEDPDLLDLIDRVEQQESGGDQSAVSSAGAVGVMQVMPDTAPEAAALAGLPWDEEAYYNDPSYNKLLGIAYLRMLLERYDGDVDLALAAYNAGPGRVDDALSSAGDNWLSVLPDETQNYVERLG